MILTPRKAIRAKCLDCSCGHPSEVRDCRVKNCPLYPHRFGKRPKTDVVTPEDGLECYTAENQSIFQEESKNKVPPCVTTEQSRHTREAIPATGRIVVLYTIRLHNIKEVNL